MSKFFDSGALEQGYGFLDQCPESLIPDVVTLPIGTLQERVVGIRRWHDALLIGRLPPDDGWPSCEIGRAARKSIEVMGLTRFTRDQPELVVSLLRDVLRSFAKQDEIFRAEVATRLAELEALQRSLDDGVNRLSSKRRRSPPDAAILKSQLNNLATSETALAWSTKLAETDTELVSQWEGRARLWANVMEVFGDLGVMLGRGLDLSLGVLKHTGWKDIERLHKLVAQLPELREVVHALGRLHASDEGESVAETILNPVRRLDEERREIRTPLIPAETRGLNRSGDIARMLPVEAIKLGHPQLRMLWHAQRAERSLLTYRVEGVEIEKIILERDGVQELQGKRPRPKRGPIVAVIDTSGSMHGTPELVAKALVLEAVRTAHSEKRRCLLYAFSGPGQMDELELDLSEVGIAALLNFLSCSFGGGSDADGVLSKVLARLKEDAWRKADVLFVSDGEWSSTGSLIQSVQVTRKEGTRFHGVQIGNRGLSGLHSVCDEVHVFTDWASLGGWRHSNR